MHFTPPHKKKKKSLATSSYNKIREKLVENYKMCLNILFVFPLLWEDSFL